MRFGEPQTPKIRIMPLKILQINLGRCWDAQHLLQRSMEEERVDVAMVSEPRVVPDTSRWIGSTDGLAAVHWNTLRFNGCRLIKRRKEYVVVQLNGVKGEIKVISCYLAPSMTWREVHDCLDSMRDDIRTLGGGVIIGGDFNAKPPCGGVPGTLPEAEI